MNSLQSFPHEDVAALCFCKRIALCLDLVLQVVNLLLQALN